MKEKRINPMIKGALEFGPIIGFLLVYLIFRNTTVQFAGNTVSGFVAITAAFIPVFVLCAGALWALTGRIARIQVFTLGMLVVFGGLGLWMNDPRIIKMKPTVIYLALALVLWVGVLRGQSWLKLLMEDMIPLKKKGWMILTKRVIGLFLLSAAANELVWRTQSEKFWVLFETLAMPVVIVLFFLAQTPLIVDHAAWGTKKKKR